jgi:hypothetical protein
MALHLADGPRDPSFDLTARSTGLHKTSSTAMALAAGPMRSWHDDLRRVGLLAASWLRPARGKLSTRGPQILGNHTMRATGP